jgi:hypothetical protein
MNNLKKAQRQLSSVGIESHIENDALYVEIGEAQLELSDMEIIFRADLYDEEQKKSI